MTAPTSTVPLPVRLTGWLLVVVALLGLATVALLLRLDPDADADLILRDVTGNGRLAGRVVDEAGDPLGEVNLSIAGTNLTTLSDGNGEFHFAAVPAGRQNLTARKEGHVTLHFHTVIVPGADRGSRVTLILAAGAGSREQVDQEQVQQLDQSLKFYATLILLLTLFVAVGALRALQGRDYAWVVGGASLGFFTFGFMLGSLLALVALGLALKYRRLYRES